MCVCRFCVCMHDTAVWADGSDLMGVAGTSCASPTAAGVFSLVNDKRLAAGKPSLGFMNPLLYKMPKALSDIDTGNDNTTQHTA
jgi:subtilase family serine protease